MPTANSSLSQLLQSCGLDAISFYLRFSLAEKLAFHQSQLMTSGGTLGVILTQKTE